jgi:hypothetical protein
MKFRKNDKDKKQNVRKVYTNNAGYADDYDDDYDASGMEEDELKAYGEARQIKRQKRKLRKRRLVFLILFALIAGLVIVNWNSIAPDALSDTLQNFFVSFGKSKYPVYFDEGSLKSTVTVGSNIGVLTDTSFLIYSQNGDELASRPHGFNNPTAVSGGGKAVIFDRNGKSFRVETRFGEPFKASAAYAITSAAVGDNGDFAIVTESDDYLSELLVYDNSYKDIFKWDASQGRILTAALSPDGRMLAAVVIGARGGNFFSDIYIFNLDSQNPVAIERYGGALFNSIRFKGNGRIAAVGDSEAVFLSATGTRLSAYSYGDNEPDCSANGDGPVIIVFKKSGTHYVVVSLDSDGKVLGTANVKAEDVSAVACNDGKAVVVSSGRIWYASDNCKTPAVVSVSGDILSAVSLGGNAYIFGTQSIARHHLT